MSKPSKKRKARVRRAVPVAARDKNMTAEWIAGLEKNYGCARSYWAQLAPFASGRLRGVQWHIVSFAWHRLREAREAWAEALSEAGEQKVSELPALPPEPEHAARAGKISPAELAAIAAALANTVRDSRTPTPIVAGDCLPAAHDLFVQAANFLEEQETRLVKEFIRVDGVTFEDILKSNRKDPKNTGLKLLPGITTEEGLVRAIRRFYKKERATRLYDDTGKQVAVAHDVSGEQYIASKKLPATVLAEIRAWHHACRSERGKRRR